MDEPRNALELAEASPDYSRRLDSSSPAGGCARFFGAEFLYDVYNLIGRV